MYPFLSWAASAIRGAGRASTVFRRPTPQEGRREVRRPYGDRFLVEQLEPRVLLSADLIGTAFEVTDAMITNGQANVQFTVKNAGNMDAGGFDIQIVHSDDDMFGNGDDVVVKTVHVNSLAAGAEAEFDEDIQLSVMTLFMHALNEDPVDQGTGAISSSVDYVGLVIDSGNTVAESNEANNAGVDKFADFDDITYFPYDVNGDGAVTPEDTILLANRVGTMASPPPLPGGAGDIDGDGMITPNDVMQVNGRVGNEANSNAVASRPAALGVVAPVLVMIVDGIQGDSQIERFKGQIELDSYSWGLSNADGLGPPQFQTFQFTSFLSTASPDIFSRIARGEAAGKIEVILADAATGAQFVKWTFTNARFVDYQVFGDASGVRESVAFDYEKVDLTLVTFDQTGRPSGKTSAGWDLKTDMPTQAQSLIASVGSKSAALAAAGVAGRVQPDEQPLTASALSETGLSYLLHLGQIAGTEDATGFKGWIPATSFSYGVSREPFAPINNPGPATFTEFNVQLVGGPHSVDLLDSVLTAKNHDFAELAVYDGSLGFDVSRWQMKDVVATSFSTNHTADAQIQEALTLSPKVAQLSVSKVKIKDGSLQRGKSILAGIDIKLLKATSITVTGSPGTQRVGQQFNVTGAPALKFGDNKFESIEAYTVQVSNDYQVSPQVTIGNRRAATFSVQTQSGDDVMLDRFATVTDGTLVDITLVSLEAGGENLDRRVVWAFPDTRLTDWSINQASLDSPPTESFSGSFRRFGMRSTPKVDDPQAAATEVAWDILNNNKTTLSGLNTVVDSMDLSSHSIVGAGQLFLFLPQVGGGVASGDYQGALPVESYSFSVSQAPLDLMFDISSPRAFFSPFSIDLATGAESSPDLFAAVLDSLTIDDNVTLALDGRNGSESKGQTMRWDLVRKIHFPVITSYSVDQSGQEKITIDFDIAQLTLRPVDVEGDFENEKTIAWDQVGNESADNVGVDLADVQNPLPVLPGSLFNDNASFFLAIPDIPGDASTNGFEHQIELSGFNFNVGNDYSAVSNSGMAPHVFFAPMRFAIGEVPSLPLIMQSLAAGDVHPEAQLTIAGNGMQGIQPLVRWRLEDAHVTSFGLDATEDAVSGAMQLDFDRIITETYDGIGQSVQRAGFDLINEIPFDHALDALMVNSLPTVAINTDTPFPAVPSDTPAGLYMHIEGIDNLDLIPIKSFNFEVFTEAFSDMMQMPTQAIFSNMFVALSDFPLDEAISTDFLFDTATGIDIGSVMFVQVTNDGQNGMATPLVVLLGEEANDRVLLTDYNTSTGSHVDRPIAGLGMKYDTIRLAFDRPGDGLQGVNAGWDVFTNEPLDFVPSFSLLPGGGFMGPVPAVSEIRDFDSLALIADPGTPVAELSYVLIDGNGMEGIQLGEIFQVEVHFTDLNPTRPFFDDGDNQIDHPFVNSGFADIFFDPDALLPISITHAPNYGASATGDINVAGGVIDEVGSSLQPSVLASLIDSNVANIDPGTLLYTITFQALAPGQTQVTANEGENVVPPGPASSATTLFGLDDDQRLNVTYDSLNIQIDDPSLQTTLVVNAPGDVDDNDFSNGVTTLREAIRIANADPNETTITFDVGMTGPTITLEGTQLEIATDIVIEGPAQTGGLNQLALDGDQLSRVLFVSPGSSLTISNLDIRNGASEAGGGILIDSAQVIADGLRLTGNLAITGGAVAIIGQAMLEGTNLTVGGEGSAANTAVDFGGGFYVHGSSGTVPGEAALMLTDSSVVFNSALATGGGIIADTDSGPNSLVTLNRVQVNNNTGQFVGGGIAGSRAVIDITDSEVNTNNSQFGGGIVITDLGFLTLTGSQVIGNSGLQGGGINNAGTVILQGSTTIADNMATDGAGVHNSGLLTISGGEIRDNIASNDGGGLFNSGNAMITNAAIRGNTANGTTSENGGGGIYNDAGGTLTVTGATIAGNTSGFHGGGIFNIQGGTVNINAGTVIGGPNTADANRALSGLLGGTGGGIANGGPTLAASGGTVNITGATIQGNTSTGSGGGLFNGPAGQMTLTDTTVSGNIGPNNDAGGGIANGRNIGGATLTVNGGRITDNSAEMGGGLFNAFESTATLTNVTIDFNNASFGGGIANNMDGVVNLNGSAVDNNMAVVGGGINNFQGGPVTVTGGSISNNQATNNAGGAFNGLATLNLSGVTMRGNSAGAGGALRNGSGGTVNITGSTIGGLTPADGNTATTDGGGGIFNEATLTITGSTLANNTAGQDGGGIFNRGTATLTNATVSTNSAVRHGGGIEALLGDVTLNNVTIANNQADSDADDDGRGGGMDHRGGTVTLNNVAIVNNTQGDDLVRDLTSDGPAINNVGPIAVSEASSSFSTVLPTPILLVNDPLLGPLADNGGPTPTHALLEGSPLIDAGVDATGTGVDQRGSTRPSDNGAIANAAGGDGSDIGAFEVLANFADLGLDVTEPAEPVVPGTVVAYTLTPSNAGPVDANDAVITVNIGSDFTFNQVGSTAGWVDQGQGQFTFALGALVANQPFGSPPVFAVMVNPNTTEIATIFVAGIDSDSTVDPNSENDGVFEVTLIQQPPAVDLTFQNVTGLATVSRGDAFNYVIDTPLNNGTVQAANVVVRATLPAGLTLDASSPDNLGWVDEGSGTVSFNVGSLFPPLPPLGPAASVLLLPVEVADVLGVPSLTTTFIISDDGASGADTNPADNTKFVTSTVNQPAGTPHVTISDVSMNEGNEGTTTVTFNVTLDANPIDTVTLNVAAADGTATAVDGDFTFGGAQLTFTPGGSLTQAVNVQVTGDTKFEPNETFNVNVSLASGTAVIDDGQGLGTIVNDDAERILLQRVGAGPNGTGSFKFSQTDPFNNLFEFSYKGGGFINVFQEADGRISLDMEDTDLKANLTVKVKGTGDKMLGSLESNAGFSKFNGKGIGFTGDIIVDGRVDSFTAGDVADQHIVSFGGSPTDKPAKLTFEQFVDVNFTSGGPVQLTLTDWLDTDPEVNRDSFTAPWAKSITVKGNRKDPDQPGAWSADIIMSGQGAPKNLSLSSLKVNELGDGVLLDIVGDVKTIDVKNAIDGVTIDLAGALGSLKFLGGHDVVVVADDIGSIKSTGSWLGGEVGASAIKSLDVKANKKAVGDLATGDLSDFTLAMSADIANSKSKAAIGKISIDGDAMDVSLSDEATLPAQAGVGSITIKGTSDALNIFAPATLKSLKLTDVQNGTLNAGSVGTIQATRWLGGAVSADDIKTLKTTGDKKANIAGDFMAATTINSDSQSQAKAVLGSASIAGVLGDFWDVIGPVGAITAGGIAGWDALILGDLKSLTSKSSFTGTFLAAFNIDKFDVKLQVADSDIVAGGPNGTNGPHVVGSFKVGSAFMNSTLKVGVDPVDGSFNNGDDLFLAGDENEIKSLAIGGAAVGDGIFVAGFVKSPVKINNIAVDPTVDSRFIIN